jgi:hypothetical protein
MSLRLSLVFTLSAMLAGCGGLASTTPAAPSNAALLPQRFDSSGSWMKPVAAKGDLLYVSDTRGSVDVFSFPDGKPVGVLRGFRNPAGLCSDPKGNVYVVDTDNLEVLKYRHGGTKPVKTLLMFGYYPFGCAVDPKSGNVAVANFTSQSQGAGSLSIFVSGQAIPRSYTNPGLNAFYFCSYDDQGNVFVDGADSGSHHTKFAELANGSSTLNTVTVDKTITYPGGVQWDGSYLAVQDAATRIIYRFKMSGTNGKSVGTVQVDGDKTTLDHQFAISGKTIVMPYGSSKRIVNKVGFWAYPDGGAITKSLTVKRAAELVGVAVSLAH